METRSFGRERQVNGPHSFLLYAIGMVRIVAKTRTCFGEASTQTPRDRSLMPHLWRSLESQASHSLGQGRKCIENHRGDDSRKDTNKDAGATRVDRENSSARRNGRQAKNVTRSSRSSLRGAESNPVTRVHCFLNSSSRDWSLRSLLGSCPSRGREPCPLHAGDPSIGRS